MRSGHGNVYTHTGGRGIGALSDRGTVDSTSTAHSSKRVRLAADLGLLYEGTTSIALVPAPLVAPGGGGGSG